MSNIVDEQWGFLKDLSLLIQYCDSYGYTLSGGELWRTKEQQKIYFDTGRSLTMKSKHLDRLAIDLNFFDDGELINCPSNVGEYWESLSSKNVWGGNWIKLRDYGHFERDITK